MLLAFGSPHAHNVILLRAKGIPAIVGAGPTVLSIPDGTVVAVDGGRGEFVVDPPEEVRRSFGPGSATLAQRQRQAQARAAEPAVTRDGVTVAVGANVGSVDDARAAAAHGADFAGLVRTEFLFLGRQDAPDVEEQFAVYRKIAESLDGRRITLRTSDVGGDKPLEFLPTPAEVNPYLGVRGIRLSLAHPELLADQLLAMVRLAQQTPVSVMFPMITTLDELFAARELLDDGDRPRRSWPPGRVAGGHDGRGAGGRTQGRGIRPPRRLLVHRHQRPDAVRAGGRPQQRCGRVDRRHVRSRSAATDSGHLSGAAGQASVSVCGEFAADERAAALLLGMGVDALSVTPPAIPATKEAVRAVDTAEAQRVAEEVLASDSAASVRARLHRD